MDINQLIKDAHENAVEKGFWDCPECDGGGCKGYDAEEMATCRACDGTGINQDPCIPDYLALVMIEIGEAIEALRTKHFAKWDEYDDRNNHVIQLTQEKINAHFALCIKNSYQDELADIYIRLFDLCGYLKFYIDPEVFCRPYHFNVKSKTPTSKLFEIDKMLHLFNRCQVPFAMIEIFQALNEFVKQEQIDIEKHILAKMAYNGTRPKKHGKEF